MRICVISVLLSFFLAWELQAQSIKNVGVGSRPESESSSLNGIQGSSAQDQAVPCRTPIGDHLCPHQNLAVFSAADIREGDPQHRSPFEFDGRAVR